MRNLLVFSVLSILFLSLNGCKDGELTKPEILAAHAWQVKAATIDPAIPIVTPSGPSATNDYYTNFMQACQKDDFITFFESGDAIRNEGAAKCIADQTVAGRWTLLSGETQLQYTEGSSVQLYSIKSMTEESIVLSYSYALLGINYTITTTWEMP